jgi:hypothetical protein
MKRKLIENLYMSVGVMKDFVVYYKSRKRELKAKKDYKRYLILFFAKVLYVFPPAVFEEPSAMGWGHRGRTGAVVDLGATLAGSSN